MEAETYNIEITAQAERQLQTIVNYIASELDVPKAVQRLLDEIESSISSLSLFPKMVALIDEEPWRSMGIHKMPEKLFSILLD